jgi:nucleotide-binding universal stress UspA family protein
MWLRRIPCYQSAAEASFLREEKNPGKREDSAVAGIANILFPVNFKPSCVAMGAYVRRAAVVTGAKVTLIHVIDPATFNALELYMRSPLDVTDDHIAAAQHRLNEFLSTEFPAPEAERLVAVGDPAREIAAAARKGFDLIMMPTHSGIFRRMLLGSTTAKVMNDADCPVETSRHAETIAPRPTEHREWVCAIGLGEDSERVLHYAHRATRDTGSHLRLVHVIPTGDPALPGQSGLEERVRSEERKQAQERVEELRTRMGLNAEVAVAVGPVKEALLKAARDADVLVIGRSPRPGAHERLRDLTYAVVRDSPCPVVSI